MSVVGSMLRRIPHLANTSASSNRLGCLLAHFQCDNSGRSWLINGNQPQRGKADDRAALIKSMPIKDQGTQGERGFDVDLINLSRDDMFPDAETPDKLYDGVRFADIPVCHIKTSKNNTLVHITDSLGEHICYRSCGMEGFKNTRKGTNIAAQATAISLASIARAKGVQQVRVKVQGLGPGRMSSIKGLQMAGLKIVSLTDATPISFNPPRPRKARRL